MGPAEVHELYEAWLDREARADMRAAMVACAMAGGHPTSYFPLVDRLLPGPPSEDELERKLHLLFGSKGS